MSCESNPRGTVGWFAVFDSGSWSYSLACLEIGFFLKVGAMDILFPYIRIIEDTLLTVSWVGISWSYYV